ncbi:MAG: Calcium-binding component of the spindle pole body (SPB) half-bridge [Claussenomyces sp. TS43310]|nr:MAG: Calcium-binding component of the spindle pole body (SPB) half-bridge [Claussenomyces sp. TS43310]
MASASQNHPAFPPRPFGSSKLPDRGAAPAGFGASTHTHAARESARLERERQDRERAAQQQQQQQQQAAGSSTSNAIAQLTDEQRDEINEAFGLFDLDKDNMIDYHEFKVALKALGFDLSKPDLLSLLTTHGIPPASANQNPQSQAQQQVPPSRLHLTLPAFQTIAASLIANRNPRDEILRAFDLFDTDGKGMISLDDLRRVARELGEGLEEEELAAMIDEFDLEGKGGVGREEFIGICMG